MGTIKAKQRSTMSKPHPTGSKANEYTLELTCFQVDVKFDRCCWVRKLNFLTVLQETGIRVSVGTVDKFDCTFPSSISFLVANIDSVKVFEMVQHDLGLDGWIRVDFGKYSSGNELCVNVTMSGMMDSMPSVNLNRCSNPPSVCRPRCSHVKSPRWSMGSRLKMYQWHSGSLHLIVYCSQSTFTGMNSKTSRRACKHVREQQSYRTSCGPQTVAIRAPKSVALPYARRGKNETDRT